MDKAKARLESLEEDDEDSTQTQLNVSQQDYVKLIDDLHSQLITAWDADQRVKALKIAIQVSISISFSFLFFSNLFLKIFPFFFSGCKIFSRYQSSSVLSKQICFNYRDFGYIWKTCFWSYFFEINLYWTRKYNTNSFERFLFFFFFLRSYSFF